jgi:4-diphosphocytidyl-2-C-methyl-D-erythritol kinase
VICVRAPAKLNLGLRILDRLADGYHEIETIFLPLQLFDRLWVEPAERPGIAFEVDDASLPSGSENLAVRAAEYACAVLQIESGFRMRLEKHIPVAAGLGGGSSDAAAALMAIEELARRRLPEPARRLVAREIGADVPFFLDPRPAVGRGVGDRLEPIAGVPELDWVLVQLPFGLSTAEAYREASRELTLPRQGSSIAALLGPAGVVATPLNDLETVAARRHPEIGMAKRALRDEGARVTGMSGSGPTVYGHFGSPEQARGAAQRMRLPEGARAIVSVSPGSSSDHWGWGVAKW